MTSENRVVRREGAGRPPLEHPMKRYTIRLPDELRERLTALGSKTVRDWLSKITAPG